MLICNSFAITVAFMRIKKKYSNYDSCKVTDISNDIIDCVQGSTLMI